MMEVGAGKELQGFPSLCSHPEQEGQRRAQNCPAGPQCWDGRCRRGGGGVVMLVFGYRCEKEQLWDVGMKPHINLQSCPWGPVPTVAPWGRGVLGLPNPH